MYISNSLLVCTLNRFDANISKLVDNETRSVNQPKSIINDSGDTLPELATLN